MKLRLMISAMAASTALFATDVTSATYGVLVVTDTTATNTVVGVPWRNVNEATLENVTLSNLVSTATLENNDCVYLYEGDTWYGWSVNNGVFVPMPTVNGQSIANPPPADSTILARGTGLIIQRAHTTDPIYLCGRNDDSNPGSTTVAAGTTMLIANPRTTLVYINNNVGAAGDQISVPGNGGTMTIYQKRDDGWYEPGGSTTVGTISIALPPVKLTDGVPLAAGKGAFYQNKGSSAVTINW